MRRTLSDYCTNRRTEYDSLNIDHEWNSEKIAYLHAAEENQKSQSLRRRRFWIKDPVAANNRKGQKFLYIGIAVNGTPSHSYGVSLAIWDHTVLPVTRHRWTHLALTPAMLQWPTLDLHVLQRDERLSWPMWTVTYRDGYTRPQTITHPSTNPAVHRWELNSQPIDHDCDAVATTPPRNPKKGELDLIFVRQRSPVFPQLFSNPDQINYYYYITYYARPKLDMWYRRKRKVRIPLIAYSSISLLHQELVLVVTQCMVHNIVFYNSYASGQFRLL